MRLILMFIFVFSAILFANDKKDTLEIGFVYWKKINAPEKYNAYVYGINKAISEINKNGKIFPKNTKLKLITFNEEGKVQKSIKIAKEIAKNNKMIAVIGFSNSPRALKAIKYVSKSNIPIISSAGSRKIFEQDVNKVFYTTNFGIQGEIQYLKKFIKIKGYNKLLFISKKKDEYSDEYYKDVAAIIKNNKRIFDKDIDINSIKKFITNKTLIIISIDVKNDAKVAKLLRDNNINNDIFLGRGGLVGGEFYNSGGYGLHNIYELSTLLAGVSNENILKFKEDNKKFFKNPKNARYLEYASYAYDCVYLIAQAYTNAVHKKVDNPKIIRETIKKGLSLITDKNPYDGVTTTYSFDKNRIGGKLMPQYILKTTGKKPTLYKKQFIYSNGILTYVPTLYTNLDIKSITIDNQEASEYTVEMMITLISEQNITLNDLAFENIVISDSSFKPSIYAKQFISTDIKNHNGLNVRIYNVKAKFAWDNTIEDFPFDSQKLPILIKPKNPINKNFINFFISDINKNLNQLNISGWIIKGGYAGFKKGFYEYIDPDLKKKKEYYYRSSFTIDVKRSALSSAIKFILPLVIVMLITIVLFALPDNAAGDKVGSGTNMLITVAALYFTYATIVNVNYLTYVDKLYMGALLFVLITSVIFILRQRFYHTQADNGGFEKPCFTDKLGIGWIFNQKNGDKKVTIYNIIYLISFLIAIAVFLWAAINFIKKANF